MPLLDHMATPKHQGAIYYQVRVDADGQAHALLGFWGRAGAGAEGGTAGLMSGDVGACVRVAALGPWAAVRPLPQLPLAQRRSVLRRAVAASC